MKIKKSTVILLIILLLYTIVSFYKLGRNKNPQTFVNLKNEEQLTYELPENTIPKEVTLYTGNDVLYLTFFLTNEYQNFDAYDYDCSYESEYVFRWHKYSINDNDNTYKYIMLQSYWDSTTIGELKIYDVDGKEIQLIPMGEREKNLLDEQDTVPTEFSYMNSSYFDEVYFPRTSYEILNNLPIYEYTHPPLGKLIIAIPMTFLGTTPFAYRLMGNIAGILMILVIYAIAKTIFKKEKYGLFAAAIMALDGMHFVQTRIGTVDSFLVLFILCSFLFFIKYLKVNKDENLKKMVTPLILSGIFWGMAISVKWIAAFAGLGMGIIYFIDYLKNKRWNIKLLMFSVLAFVIIPILIYVLSYVPIILNPNEGITGVKSFFEYQKKMFEYHSKLEAEHPFTSPWYTWPIMQKPIWYYEAYFENGKYGTISGMGNPAIWWLSILTALFTLVHFILKRDSESMIIILMILSTWIPYAFISRIMFIYHYFITLPFMMLTIVYAVYKLVEWKPKMKHIITLLTIIFLGFFIYFYPIYSGLPVNRKYVDKTQWFDTWIY